MSHRRDPALRLRETLSGGGLQGQAVWGARQCGVPGGAGSRVQRWGGHLRGVIQRQFIISFFKFNLTSKCNTKAREF